MHTHTHTHTHRSDKKAGECANAQWSPIRFLYASEFNVDAANAVITKLKDQTKDANAMTLFDAHTRMGPCYDSPPIDIEKVPTNTVEETC
jgi:hypothetical protein